MSWIAQPAESSHLDAAHASLLERSRQVTHVFDLIRYLTGEEIKSVQVRPKLFCSKSQPFVIKRQRSPREDGPFARIEDD
jgi:hypothetical protein